MGQSFEFIDRRGQKKEPRVVEPAAPEVPEGEDRSSWKNVGYMVTLLNSQNGMIVSGRAVGLRSDGKPFVADYLLPPVYPEGLDWTAVVKKRLDTFLNCGCDEKRGACATHKMYIPQWMQADSERLTRMAQEPLPEAVEVLIRAEQSRKQASIVVPGR